MPDTLAPIKTAEKALTGIRRMLNNQGLMSINPDSEEGRYVFGIWREFRASIKGDYNDFQRDYIAEIQTCALLMFRTSFNLIMKAGGSPKISNRNAVAINAAMNLAKGINKQSADLLMQIMKATGQEATPGTEVSYKEVFEKMKKVANAKQIISDPSDSVQGPTETIIDAE